MRNFDDYKELQKERNSHLTDLTGCKTYEDKFKKTFNCEIDTFSDEHGLCYIKFINLLERDYGYNRRRNYKIDEFLEIKFGKDVEKFISYLLIN